MRRLWILFTPVLFLIAACGNDSYDNESGTQSLSTRERFAKIEELAADMAAPPRDNGSNADAVSSHSLQMMAEHAVKITEIAQPNDARNENLLEGDIDEMPITDLVFFVFSQVTTNLDQMLRNQMQNLQHKSQQVEQLFRAYSLLTNAPRTDSSYEISEVLQEPIATQCRNKDVIQYTVQTDNLTYDLSELHATSNDIKEDLKDGHFDYKQDAYYLKETLLNIKNSSAEAENSVPGAPQHYECQPTAADILRRHDITIETGRVSSSRFNEILDAIHQKQSSLNSTIQMEMTKLHSLDQKYNQAFEACSNLMKTNFQDLSEILRNL